MLLKDKVAIIAGDAYGIGQAAAILFAREGAHVVCIDDKPGMEHARTIRIGDLEAPYHHADVTQSEQVQAVASACEKTLQKVDILFNIAGRGVIKQAFEQTTEATWSTMIARKLSITQCPDNQRKFV